MHFCKITILSGILLLNLPGNLVGVATTVTNTNNSGPGSLRQAILNVNAGSHDEIDFNIPGTAPHTIHLTSGLPSITNPVLIDGTTQPGWTCGAPVVVIDGTNAGSSNGLTLAAGSDGSTIKGLVINNFNRNGILIDTSFNNTILGNFLGTNYLGTIAQGNGRAGIDSNSSVIKIGSAAVCDRNLISGNFWSGIIMSGFDNDIINNYIGTDISGTTAIGNQRNGIELVNNDNTRVKNNLVSGNVVNGIKIGYPAGAQATNCIVTNNIIGTNATVTEALSNMENGIEISGELTAGNVIGSASSFNIISGNAQNGVAINEYASDNIVIGNYIGTNAKSLSLPNEQNGIRIGTTQTGTMGNNLIGGTTSGTPNIIVNNIQNGISIESQFNSANNVQHNFIGTDASNKILGNHVSGVNILQSLNNNIGGSIADLEAIALEKTNIIKNNGGAGVIVTGDLATGNAILTNSIYKNTGIGIDLNNDGITPNHALSPTTGPNNYQNYPVLTAAINNGSFIAVSGSLNSVPNTAFIIQFFNNQENIANKTEGQLYIGQISVATNSKGFISFSAIFSIDTVPYKFISSTATRLNGGPEDTSEFSLNIVINNLNTSCVSKAVIKKYCTI